MWYVCDILYAVLYVRASCFVVRGCAVSSRYINVCNCDMFSVVNVYLDNLKFCVVYIDGRRYERLKSLGLYSLQRRRERYCIIYSWKMIEGLALIFLTLLQVHFLNVEAGHASFPMSMWVAFVLLPIYLRSISSWSVLRFKTQLDIFIGSVEDLPYLPGFNNSLDGGDCRWWSPRDGLATN